MNLAALQLLRLASPSLPIGGYSYSQGLESALELGLVSDSRSAQAWIAGVLTGPLSRFEAALLVRVWCSLNTDDTSALVALNARLLASRDGRELRAETEQMGYSLKTLLAALPEGQGRWPAVLAEGPVALPVAWAVAAFQLELDAAQAVESFLWGWMENQVMVLMKAMPMGQTSGQQLLSVLLPVVAQATQTALTLPDEEISNFAPMLAWVAAQHETQYSRLFRS
ncbi:urease accessory protein UreF [Craterilacuibacter sp.]|uniref:urease accessory protein UreF n=1 Tax=Craterilacuibacter sp. TaxID=2870909 RepID=UPI003F3B02E8